MAHWFDDLTKGLARGTFSRRAMLRSVLKTGAAAAGAALLGRSGGLGELVLAGSATQQEGPCNIRHEGSDQILTLSADSTFKGRRLTYRQTARISSPRGEMTTSKIIRMDGSPLLQIEEVKRSGSTQITIDYGKAFFPGVQRAVLSSSDGKTLEGAFDNRRIVPFAIGSDPSTVKFADGNPPPKSNVEPDIPEAIRSIFAQAKQSAATCSSGAIKRAHALSTAPTAFPQDDSGHVSNTYGMSCFACSLDCFPGFGLCGLLVAEGCLGSFFLYPFCVGIGLGVCGGKLGSCFTACYATGGACCPVGCGLNCCNKGETCLNPATGTCCSTGLTNCGNKHCCKHAKECIPATGVCCPEGRVICKHACCKKGEACIDGKCCPNPCGDVCCAKLSQCADANKGLCCGFGIAVCNHQCCKANQTCVNGKCCANPCDNNKVCCAHGQECQNGKCSSNSIKCRTMDEVMCIPKVDKVNDGAAICCPPRVACCLGKCCKPGEVCCGRGNNFGCHGPSMCID